MSTSDQLTNQVKRLLKLRKQSMKVTDIDGQMVELNAYHIKQQELQLVGLTMIDLSYILPDMKTIKYNNKTIKLPFKDADYSDTPLEMETVSNPFSGQSIAMPKFAVAVYDVTMGSNLIAEKYDQAHGMGTSPDWDNVRKGLDWFRRYFAKEYMVLLD